MSVSGLSDGAPACVCETGRPARLHMAHRLVRRIQNLLHDEPCYVVQQVDYQVPEKGVGVTGRY